MLNASMLHAQCLKTHTPGIPMCGRHCHITRSRPWSTEREREIGLSFSQRLVSLYILSAGTACVGTCLELCIQYMKGFALSQYLKGFGLSLQWSIGYQRFRAIYRVHRAISTVNVRRVECLMRHMRRVECLIWLTSLAHKHFPLAHIHDVMYGDLHVWRLRLQSTYSLEHLPRCHATPLGTIFLIFFFIFKFSKHVMEEDLVVLLCFPIWYSKHRLALGTYVSVCSSFEWAMRAYVYTQHLCASYYIYFYIHVHIYIYTYV